MTGDREQRAPCGEGLPFFDFLVGRGWAGFGFKSFVVKEFEFIARISLREMREAREVDDTSFRVPRFRFQVSSRWPEKSKNRRTKDRKNRTAGVVVRPSCPLLFGAKTGR